MDRRTLWLLELLTEPKRWTLRALHKVDLFELLVRANNLMTFNILWDSVVSIWSLIGDDILHLSMNFAPKIGYYHRWMVNCIKLFALTNHPSSSWNPLSVKQNINISDGMDNGNNIEMDRNTNNWYWLPAGLTCRTRILTAKLV